MRSLLWEPSSNKCRPAAYMSQPYPAPHMRSYSLLLPALFLLTITACKKDDDEAPVPTPPTPMDVSEFSQLEPGNYWVYERRQVDSMDVVQGAGVSVDSVFVAGDTALNGQTYTMLRKATNGVLSNYRVYRRDSADCVVDDAYFIHFASNTFDQILESTYTGGPNGLQVDYSVSSTPVTMTTPAGTFNCYVVNGAMTSIGTFPVIAEWKSPRYYWAAGVGRVRWTDYFAFGDLGNRFELVRYSVQ